MTQNQILKFGGGQEFWEKVRKRHESISSLHDFLLPRKLFQLSLVLSVSLMQVVFPFI